MTPPAPQPAAPACLPVPQNIKAARILTAAAQLLPSLERGSALDARLLREAMTAAFEGSDQDGAWLWKDAYEASEAAAVQFLRKYGQDMLKKAASAARYLSMLERLAALLPSHTRRSEESDQFQQFSTPLGLGFLPEPRRAGAPRRDRARAFGGHRTSCHPCGDRRSPARAQRTRRNAPGHACRAVSAGACHALQRRADRRLSRRQHRAGCVLMNPPFSASPNIERSMRDATVRHIRSALRRVANGGRLVVLTARIPRSSERGHPGALCRSRGTASFRVHRHRRWPHLCTARHQRRHAAYGHRPDSGNKWHHSYRGRPCGHASLNFSP